MTMILLTSIVISAVVLCLLIYTRRLVHAREHLRRISEAWQDYACAIEVAFECILELDDEVLCNEIG